jgi:hypothetical protein
VVTSSYLNMCSCVRCGACGEVGMARRRSTRLQQWNGCRRPAANCQAVTSRIAGAGWVSVPNMQWRMPEEGTLKINVDGVLSQESVTGATGAVL